MVYKRPPYTPAAAGFDDEDAALLAAEGFDTVRVGVIWKAVEPSPGVYDDAYLTAIKATVDSLQRHGIVSVIDFHQDLYNERFQGEGAPDWAVLDHGLPAMPQLGFPRQLPRAAATHRAFDHFWDNDAGPGGIGLQDRFAATWRHAARFFKDDPGVLGHELFNEPWPGTTWTACANAANGCPVFEGKLTRFGERVLSPPGAAVLHVLACPGATRVRVTVSAKDRTSTASCKAGKRPNSLGLKIQHARLVPGRRTLIGVRVRRASTSRAVDGATVVLAPAMRRGIKTNRFGTAVVRVRVPRAGLTLQVSAPGAKTRTARLAPGSRRRP